MHQVKLVGFILIAEGVGVEPTDRLRGQRLAIFCITVLPTLQTPYYTRAGGGGSLGR